MRTSSLLSLFLAATLLSGCPREPEPSFKIISAPTTQEAATTPTAPPPRRVHFKLAPAETKTESFAVGGSKHEVSAELIRFEVVDDPAELDDELLHPKTLGELKGKGPGSFMICELEIKIDGKPLSDPSVKGTFRSVGLEFSYGGQVYDSKMGYVGPASGRPDAHLHVQATEDVRGDGEWRLIQSLYLEDQTKIDLEFGGKVKLPEAG